MEKLQFKKILGLIMQICQPISIILKILINNLGFFQNYQIITLIKNKKKEGSYCLVVKKGQEEMKTIQII